MRREALYLMHSKECAAEAWWSRMSAKEQEAYLRAHPASRMSRRGEALVRSYLGGEGAERDAAGHAITRAGHALPTENDRARGTQSPRHTPAARGPAWRPAGRPRQEGRDVTRNEGAGFYATHARNIGGDEVRPEHWDEASRMYGHVHNKLRGMGLSHGAARDFLDSSHGRHLADELSFNRPVDDYLHRESQRFARTYDPAAFDEEFA